MGRCLGTVGEGDYWQLPYGKVILHGNELHVVTENADPAALSLLGFTGGKISWKDDGGSEKVCLQLRQNAKGDGEIYFGVYNQARFDAAVSGALGPGYVLKALDYAMQEVAVLNPEGFEMRVPVKASAGIVGGVSGGVTRFTSDNGRFVFNVQGDENPPHIVVYDTWDANGHPVDEAVWSQHPIADWQVPPVAGV